MSKEKAVTSLTCVVCRRVHQSSQLPRKPYKQWLRPGGIKECYCDDYHPDKNPNGKNCFKQAAATRVYKFGSGGEKFGGFDGIALAKEQMRIMNDMRNELVAIDRENTIEYRRLTADPEIKRELDAMIAEQKDVSARRKQLKSAKSYRKHKNKTVDTTPIDDEYSQLTVSLNSLNIDIKEKRKDLAATKEKMREVNKPLIAQLQERTRAAIGQKDKNHSEGGVVKKYKPLLHWDQLQFILSKYKVSSAKAKKEGTLLQFHRFDGTGTLSIVETNGELPDQFFSVNADSGKFRVGPLKKTVSGHGQGRMNEIRDVFIRVKSGDKGVPVWLKVPTVFHRPLPEGTSMQNAQVTLRQGNNGQPVWNVCISVREPKATGRVTPSIDRNALPATIAIDLGWRKTPDGLRVAYWADSLGNHGELVLGPAYALLFSKLSDLQQIQKKNLNEIQSELAPWLRSIYDDASRSQDPRVAAVMRECVSLPGCAVNEAISIEDDQAKYRHQYTGSCIHCGKRDDGKCVALRGRHQYVGPCLHCQRKPGEGASFTVGKWHSSRRMIQLLKTWKVNRFPGDQEMFAKLNAWYHGDPTTRQAHRQWKGQDTWSVAQRNRTNEKPHLRNGHRHLQDWEKNLREELLSKRKDYYRTFAAALSRGARVHQSQPSLIGGLPEGQQYSCVVIGNFDLRDVAQKPKKDDMMKAKEISSQQDKLSRRQRTQASVSELRTALENVCDRDGLKYISVDSTDTTQTCNVCGGCKRFNAAKEIVHQCNCTLLPHQWDQDKNRAINLLERGLVKAYAMSVEEAAEYIGRRFPKVKAAS